MNGAADSGAAEVGEREGDVKLIDPKYGIEVRNGEPVIVKAATGEAIPDDEPLMLFRARDNIAVEGALIPYMEACIYDECTDYHMAGIHNRIHAFEDFAKEHPERMKQPGVTMGR